MPKQSINIYFNPVLRDMIENGRFTAVELSQCAKYEYKQGANE